MLWRGGGAGVRIHDGKQLIGAKSLQIRPDPALSEVAETLDFGGCGGKQKPHAAEEKRSAWGASRGGSEIQLKSQLLCQLS